jgi:protein BCP1
VVNVDFEWFDPQPAVDFHGLKNLLRQLFDADAQLFDLSALTDLMLRQPLLGSTVKVGGNETDPYAFLSVLNLREHKVLYIRMSSIFLRWKYCIQNSPLRPTSGRARY